jgi:hypothetical protein
VVKGDYVSRRVALIGLTAALCRGASAAAFCSRNSACLVDRQSLRTWEVCGSRRERSKEEGGFWDQLTEGLVAARGLLSTSPDGRLLGVLDSSGMFVSRLGRQIVKCLPNGKCLAKMSFPFTGTIGDVRM